MWKRCISKQGHHKIYGRPHFETSLNCELWRHNWNSKWFLVALIYYYLAPITNYPPTQYSKSLRNRWQWMYEGTVWAGRDWVVMKKFYSTHNAWDNVSKLHSQGCYHSSLWVHQNMYRVPFTNRIGVSWYIIHPFFQFGHSGNASLIMKGSWGSTGEKWCLLKW